MNPTVLLWIEAGISVVLAVCVVVLQRVNSKLVVRVLELTNENTTLRKGSKPNEGELGGVQEDSSSSGDD